MLAKQSTITLPADYDVEIIRRRVQERAGAFDAFPGIAFTLHENLFFSPLHGGMRQ